MKRVMKTLLFAMAIFSGGLFCSCSCKVDKKAAQKVMPIEVPVPERPAGQKDVLGLVTPKLDTVRVGTGSGRKIHAYTGYKSRGSL